MATSYSIDADIDKEWHYANHIREWRRMLIHDRLVGADNEAIDEFERVYHVEHQKAFKAWNGQNFLARWDAEQKTFAHYSSEKFPFPMPRPMTVDETKARNRWRIAKRAAKKAAAALESQVGETSGETNKQESQASETGGVTGEQEKSQTETKKQESQAGETSEETKKQESQASETGGETGEQEKSQTETKKQESQASETGGETNKQTATAKAAKSNAAGGDEQEGNWTLGERKKPPTHPQEEEEYSFLGIFFSRNTKPSLI